MQPSKSMQQIAGNDEQLISLFRNEQTKERAFTLILERYKEKLYWHIRRMVISHTDADDVLQNTFIKAWNGLQNFRGDSSIATWLYRIATNESLTFIDKRKRANEADIDNHMPYLENTLKCEKNFDENKAVWKLQMALQQLPEKQRLVFNMRYFEEMPYAEMSKVLETSEGALKASYHHAVKKIEDYILNQ